VPVPKPPAHHVGSDSDHLWLDLADSEVEAVHEALRDLEAELAQDPQAEESSIAWVATLADLWNEAESSRSDAV
jgi:hypothetical protein